MSFEDEHGIGAPKRKKAPKKKEKKKKSNKKA